MFTAMVTIPITTTADAGPVRQTRQPGEAAG